MEVERKVETKLFNVQDFKLEELPEFLPNLIPLGWIELLRDYETEISDAGKTLCRLVKNERQLICPRPHDIFKALTLTPWWEVKVVIIGQDPYYQADDGIPSATGCCFECRPGDPIRQSLKNIFTVLKKTIDGFEIPDSGDLSKWASQGVLLLNASLTTNANVANAHKSIWKFFPLRILQFLSKKRKNVVYMLWGRDAQAHRDAISTSTNLILTSSHPVAQGAANDFLRCDHFNDCNRHLVATGQTPIDWRLK